MATRKMFELERASTPLPREQRQVILLVGFEVAPFQWTVCQLAVYVLVMAACMSAS